LSLKTDVLHIADICYFARQFNHASCSSW